MSTHLTRRSFLKTGCITAAALGLALVGGGALAASYQPKVDLPTTHLGAPSGGKRILVAYASKAGSTAEVAARIGETLSRKGLAVDVLPVDQAADLTPYQAVVLGSAIRVGKLLPEALAFIEKNQAALQKAPFNVFVVCMTLKDDTPENRKTVSAYLDPVRKWVKPANEGLFAGKIDPARLKLFERLAVAAMKVPIGDFRNWDAINTWSGVID
jgi:menaquinone-dependent protoporphyrinogen oxidase